jgi:hypothetical protein
MHRKAHRLFAAGTCAVISLALGLGAGSVITLALLSGACGALADSDQRLPFSKHRGFTHTFTFALLLSLLLALPSSYLQWLLASALPQGAAEALTPGISDSWGVPLPDPIPYLAKGEMGKILLSPFLASWLSLFVGLATHIALDVITPSGLEFWGHKMSGGILSEDARANGGFSAAGVLLLLSSISMSLLPEEGWTIPISTLALPVALAFCIVAPLLLALRLKGTRRWRRMQCYSVDGKEFCTWRKCAWIDGERVCLVADGPGDEG